MSKPYLRHRIGRNMDLAEFRLRAAIRVLRGQSVAVPAENGSVTVGDWTYSKSGFTLRGSSFTGTTQSLGWKVA